MERKIIETGDGSKTIHLPQWNEQYHSKHGAIREAYHVFIHKGLDHFKELEHFRQNFEKTISILEIGFGTGLNALITLLESKKANLIIDYCGVEAYPVKIEEVEELNYSKELNIDSEFFEKVHKASWEERHEITTTFSLTKQNKFFDEINETNLFDIIYFDAFGARVQPELWTEVIFSKMFKALKTNGILVTYSAKGSVRRAMIASGFKVERLPGPPRKREMLRATKIAF